MIGKVLTIQSHVVSGFVGNRAAAFVLQRMGIEALILNTVQFSNHTGYGRWTGQAFKQAHLDALLDGLLDLSALDSVGGLLSGYLGSVETGAVVMRAAQLIRKAGQGRLYCCDPVMGDTGRGLFVAPEIPAFFAEEAIPQADIVTPNLYELGVLTGAAEADLQELNTLLDATAQLRAKGPAMVLVTSVSGHAQPDGEISMLLDSAEASWRVTTPRLHFDIAPNGSGDTTAALFLGHYLQSGDAAKSLARTSAGIYALFDATWRAGTRELQLIAAQQEVVAPQNLFRVEQLR